MRQSKMKMEHLPMEDFSLNVLLIAQALDITRFSPLPEIGRQLYAKYSFSAPGRQFIESIIKPMG